MFGRKKDYNYATKYLILKDSLHLIEDYILEPILEKYYCQKPTFFYHYYKNKSRVLKLYESRVAPPSAKIKTEPLEKY